MFFYRGSQHKVWLNTKLYLPNSGDPDYKFVFPAPCQKSPPDHQSYVRCARPSPRYPLLSATERQGIALLIPLLRRPLIEAWASLKGASSVEMEDKEKQKDVGSIKKGRMLLRKSPT